MKNQNEILTSEIKGLIWKFAIPSIISMVVLALYNIVDRIYIGNIPEIGTTAMTGVGLTAPLTTIGFSFAMLIGVGAGTMLSIKLGEGKKDEANRIFNNAMELMILGTVIMMAVGWLLLRPILSGLGADSVTMPYAFSYMVWLLGGLLFSNVGFLLNNSLRATGYPKIVTWINVIGTALNMILDPIFIFGFNMGIQGAAIATVISQFVSMAVALWFFYQKRSELPLKIKKPNWRMDWSQAGKIVGIGMAPFLTQVANTVVLILVNQSLMKLGGNDAIAAMTILFSIQNLVFLPLIGFAQGLQPIIGFNFGAGLFTRIRSAMKYGMKAVLVYGVIALILVEVTPNLLVRIFTNDPSLQAMTVNALRIFLMTVPFVGLQVVGSNFFQFTGKAKMATVLSLLRQVIVFIPALLIMPTLIKPAINGIWWSAPVSDTISIVITMTALWFTFKKIPRQDVPVAKVDLAKLEKDFEREDLPADTESEVSNVKLSK